MKYATTRTGEIWGFADDARPEALGLLPQMLSSADPRPAREQLDTAYAHGGGWRPFSGFTRTGGAGDPTQWALEYPGDDAMELVAYTMLRDETIALFDGSWVAIVQPDGGLEIARMD